MNYEQLADEFVSIAGGEERLLDDEHFLGDGQGVLGPLTPPIDAEPESDHDEPPRFNSWQRQALDDILDGEYVPEVATLLPRIDGVGLLYPGRTHSIHAESESGKSLILQYEAARLLNLGEAVAYIDYESDGASVVRRLLDLAADPEAVRARFDYRRPEIAPTVGTDEYAEWLGLLDSRYALVIIDGVTEAMDLMAPKGAGVDVNERIAGFLRGFPNRIAEHTGGAVVLIDHVVKNPESRGRHAIGGQHKLNGLTGAAYTVEVKTQPRRGHIGELHLFVAKDRPAGVRPHCGKIRSDRTQLAAVVTIDSTGEQMFVTVKPPSGGDSADDGKPLRPTVLMERLSRWLEAHSGEHSRDATTNAVPGKKQAKLFALDLLVAEGYATEIEYQRGSVIHRYYTHQRLFTVATDPEADTDNDNTVPPVPKPFPDRS